MNDIPVVSINIHQDERHSYFARNGRMIKSDSRPTSHGGFYYVGCYTAAKGIFYDSFGELDYVSALIACWKAVIRSKEEQDG